MIKIFIEYKVIIKTLFLKNLDFIQPWLKIEYNILSWVSCLVCDNKHFSYDMNFKTNTLPFHPKKKTLKKATIFNCPFLTYCQVLAN